MHTDPLGTVGRTRAARIALGAALLALAACSNPIDLHGDRPDPAKLAEIKPGLSTKATVTQLLGSPSSTAAFDDNVWYYISDETQMSPFAKPKRLDQQVVAINFNAAGVVDSVTHKTMADAEHITPDPNATPAPGRKFTFLEQLIGNFGRFNNNENNSSTLNTPGGGP